MYTRSNNNNIKHACINYEKLITPNTPVLYGARRYLLLCAFLYNDTHPFRFEKFYIFLFLFYIFVYFLEEINYLFIYKIHLNTRH